MPMPRANRHFILTHPHKREGAKLKPKLHIGFTHTVVIYGDLGAQCSACSAHSNTNTRSAHTTLGCSVIWTLYHVGPYLAKIVERVSPLKKICRLIQAGS